MVKHRYALIMRPPGPGALPGRGLARAKGEHFYAPSGHFAWGWAEYDRDLTDEEISDYELEMMDIETPQYAVEPWRVDLNERIP